MNPSGVYLYGVYLYGVVGAAHPVRLGGLTGVGGPPRAVTTGPVTAVVGDVPPGLRARRRHLLAHHGVLDALARQGTVLPTRFGVVAPDEQALRRDLANGAGRYLELLAELDGRIELNVKVLPDEDRLIREIAAEPAVRALRTRDGHGVMAGVELGRVVAAAMTARHESAARDVLDHLAPLSVRTHPGPPVRGCALNAGFLVDSDRADAFLAAASTLDRGMEPRMRLRCTGPLPPYSFVDDQER